MEELFEEIESYIENLEDMSNGPESLPAIACGEIRTRLFKIEEDITSRNAEIEEKDRHIDSLIEQGIEAKDMEVDLLETIEAMKAEIESMRLLFQDCDDYLTQNGKCNGSIGCGSILHQQIIKILDKEN